jgi:hypothetical protein
LLSHLDVEQPLKRVVLATRQPRRSCLLIQAG